MIRHIVLWELQATEEPEKAAAVAALTEALESLPAKIFQIRALSLGRDVGIDGNWDLALTVDFDSVADLQAYQRHPEHVQVAAIVREHTLRRAAVDVEV